MRLVVGEFLRDLEDARHAHAVVDGAVVDLVRSRHVGLHAQMVPMRRIQNILVGMLRAADHAHDVARVDMRDGRMRVGRKAVARHRHGLEAGLVGGGLQRDVVEAGALEEFFRRVERDPAFDRRAVHVLVGHVEPGFRARVRIAHHLPAIGRRHRFVHDDRGRSTLPCRFFVFVGPAAVIGHRLALEELRIGIGVFVAGIVDEDDDGLPLHVEAGIVVPVVLGRDHAVADEHQRRVLHVHIRRLVARGPVDGIVGEFRRQRALRRGEGEARLGRIERDVHGRHRLEIASVIAGQRARSASSRRRAMPTPPRPPRCPARGPGRRRPRSPCPARPGPAR